jgi:hypothetical protein
MIHYLLEEKINYITGTNETVLHSIDEFVFFLMKFGVVGEFKSR